MMTKRKMTSRIEGVVKTPCLFFICSLLLLTAGCDPGVTYTRTIDNQTDFAMNLYGALEDSSEVISLDPSTEYPVEVFTHTGNLSEHEDCAAIFFGNLMIEVDDKDSLELTLNPNDLSNWLFSIQKEGPFGGGICECRMVLTNNNIE